MDIKNMLYDDQYLYCVNPCDDEPIMLLSGGIGEFENVCGPIFERELYNLDKLGKSKIHIIINSQGGDVLHGQMIYSAIRKTTTPVDTYCAGQALSIAAVIFLAGQNRVMADYAVLLFHNPWSVNGIMDEYLESIRKSLIKMISKDNGNDLEIEAMMARETTINAEDSLRVGFATEIETTSDKTIEVMDSKKEMDHKYNFANLILNKFVDKIKIKGMDIKDKEELLKFSAAMNKVVIPEVKNSTDTDSEDEDAEERREDYEDQDAKNEMEEVVDDCTTEVMDDVEDDTMDKKEVEDLKNELKTLKDELKALKDEKAKNEKEANDKKIATRISNFIQNGKISNDEKSIAIVKAQLEKDFDSTVALFDTVKATKIAPKMPIEHKGAGKIANDKQSKILQDLEMMRSRDLKNKTK